MENRSFFVESFGNAPIVRIIDFLLENRIFDFTKADIADGSDVSRVTLEKLWPHIVSMGLVIKTRRIGNGVLYMLNKKSPVARKLTELDKLVTNIGTEKMFAKGKVSWEPIRVSALPSHKHQ